MLHTRIDDGDGADAERLERRDRRRRLGKALAIPGEDPVAVHVVDIEMDRVERDGALAETLGQGAHVAVGAIAPARLMEAERPQRRQQRAAGQARELLDDYGRGRSGEDVIVQLAAQGEEREHVLVFAPDVESAEPGRVQQQTPGQPRTHGHEGRLGLIEIVLAQTMTGHGAIDRPVGQTPMTAVEPSVALAEAEIALVRGHAFAHADADARLAGRQFGVGQVFQLGLFQADFAPAGRGEILGEDLPLGCGEGQHPGTQIEPSDQTLGLHPEPTVLLTHRESGWRQL